MIRIPPGWIAAPGARARVFLHLPTNIKIHSLRQQRWVISTPERNGYDEADHQPSLGTALTACQQDWIPRVLARREYAHGQALAAEDRQESALFDLAELHRRLDGNGRRVLCELAAERNFKIFS